MRPGAGQAGCTRRARAGGSSRRLRRRGARWRKEGEGRARDRRALVAGVERGGRGSSTVLMRPRGSPRRRPRTVTRVLRPSRTCAAPREGGAASPGPVRTRPRHPLGHKKLLRSPCARSGTSSRGSDAPGGPSARVNGWPRGRVSFRNTRVCDPMVWRKDCISAGSEERAPLISTRSADRSSRRPSSPALSIGSRAALARGRRSASRHERKAAQGDDVTLPRVRILVMRSSRHDGRRGRRQGLQGVSTCPRRAPPSKPGRRRGSTATHVQPGTRRGSGIRDRAGRLSGDARAPTRAIGRVCGATIKRRGRASLARRPRDPVGEHRRDDLAALRLPGGHPPTLFLPASFSLGDTRARPNAAGAVQALAPPPPSRRAPPSSARTTSASRRRKVPSRPAAEGRPARVRSPLAGEEDPDLNDPPHVGRAMCAWIESRVRRQSRRRERSTVRSTPRAMAKDGVQCELARCRHPIEASLLPFPPPGASDAPREGPHDHLRAARQGPRLPAPRTPSSWTSSAAASSAPSRHDALEEHVRRPGSTRTVRRAIAGVDEPPT